MKKQTSTIAKGAQSYGSIYQNQFQNPRADSRVGSYQRGSSAIPAGSDQAWRYSQQYYQQQRPQSTTGSQSRSGSAGHAIGGAYRTIDVGGNDVGTHQQQNINQQQPQYFSTQMLKTTKMGSAAGYYQTSAANAPRGSAQVQQNYQQQPQTPQNMATQPIYKNPKQADSGAGYGTMGASTAPNGVQKLQRINSASNIQDRGQRFENVLDTRLSGHYRQQQQNIQGSGSSTLQYVQTKPQMPNVGQAPQFYQYSGQSPVTSSAANLKFNASNATGSIGDNRRGSVQSHGYSNSGQVYGRMIDQHQQIYMNTPNKAAQYNDGNYYKLSQQQNQPTSAANPSQGANSNNAISAGNKQMQNSASGAKKEPTSYQRQYSNNDPSQASLSTRATAGPGGQGFASSSTQNQPNSQQNGKKVASKHITQSKQYKTQYSGNGTSFQNKEKIQQLIDKYDTTKNRNQDAVELAESKSQRQLQNQKIIAGIQKPTTKPLGSPQMNNLVEQAFTGDQKGAQQQPGPVAQMAMSVRNSGGSKFDFNASGVPQPQSTKNAAKPIVAATTTQQNKRIGISNLAQRGNQPIADLRKIRDESTQGSRSRAPTLATTGLVAPGAAQQAGGKPHGLPTASQTSNIRPQSKTRQSMQLDAIQQRQGAPPTGSTQHLSSSAAAKGAQPGGNHDRPKRSSSGVDTYSQQKGFYQHARETRESSNAAPSRAGDAGAKKIDKKQVQVKSLAQINDLRNNTQRKSEQNFFAPTQEASKSTNLLPPSSSTSHLPKKQFSATTQSPFLSKQLKNMGDEQLHLERQALTSFNSQAQEFIGQKNIDVKALFKQNQQQVTSQIKVDPFSGANQRIQQLTTLDINKMIHEVSADEELEGQKLPLQPGARIIIPNKEPTKCSIKRNGIVRAYSAITNQGLVRNYNEDRVSIILNITKPDHRKDENWPKCSFFGVYDGHGGQQCAEFLRDQLHHFVIKQDCFPSDPKQAIIQGFQKAEETFLQMCQGRDENGNPTVIDRSGSCAIVILIVGEMCYSANVGDSRAIISINGGQLVMPLSRDHKPSDVQEYQRIIRNGGQVYQTTTAQCIENDPKALNKGQKAGANGKKEPTQNEPEYIIGPIRVLPGRLSVSRTFGDPEAKLPYRGGNMNVVKAEPEIRQFVIHKNHDFILLASDGVFDKMSNEDIARCVWESCDKNKWQQNPNFRPAQSVHQQCGIAVESVLKNSLYRQSLDNVTVVMISFLNFKRQVFGKSKTSEREEQAEKSGDPIVPSASAPDVFYAAELKNTKSSFNYAQDDQQNQKVVSASQVFPQGNLKQQHGSPIKEQSQNTMLKRTNSVAELSYEKSKTKFQVEKISSQQKALKASNTASKKGLVQYAFKEGIPLSGRMTEQTTNTKRMSYANNGGAGKQRTQNPASGNQNPQNQREREQLRDIRGTAGGTRLSGSSSSQKHIGQTMNQQQAPRDDSNVYQKVGGGPSAAGTSQTTGTGSKPMFSSQQIRRSEITNISSVPNPSQTSGISFFNGNLAPQRIDQQNPAGQSAFSKTLARSGSQPHSLGLQQTQSQSQPQLTSTQIVHQQRSSQQNNYLINPKPLVNPALIMNTQQQQQDQVPTQPQSNFNGNQGQDHRNSNYQQQQQKQQNAQQSIYAQQMIQINL